MRGKLTPEISAKARELLNREITQEGLRLMPYIQYVMVNDQRLDQIRISSRERGVLSEWRKAGWIEGGVSGLSVTKEFWDAINKLIWMGYVDYD